MEFRLPFDPPSFNEKINLSDKLFLIGSCFTEQMGNKLDAHMFQTIQNPSGILFNPVSICTSIQQYIDNKFFEASDLFFHNELWGSWDHHTRFSATTKEASLQKINTSIEQAHIFLKQTDWLMITLGSSFVYRMDSQFVANCHKVPTDKFEKVLLSADEITKRIGAIITKLQSIRSNIRILFTISPVRHLRDGFVENNRSKANLITAVHNLTQQFNQVYYFPAYELIIDDLRDYRFYAEDMVHPNYTATNYVWEKFLQTTMNADTRDLLKEIQMLNNAFNHKPFNPDSEQHMKFKRQCLKHAIQLKQGHPYLNLDRYIEKFSS